LKQKQTLLITSVTALALAASCPSCKPELGDRESLVTDTRILAVRGVPPEAAPAEAILFDLLVATPNGPIEKPIASWGFCSTAKLLTENGAASTACLQPGGTRPLAEGPSAIEVAMPNDACSIFGPDISSADARPRDPDITGGFYQPLRVTVFNGSTTTLAFGLERIRCTIAAGAQIATEFGKRYGKNVNPELLPLAANDVPLDQPIARGRRLTLRASWPPTSAETYVVFDVAEGRLVDRRESLRVSWFATAGSFDADRTGRAETEPETFTENVWTAPDEARTVHIYVVLRDARGGVAFTTRALTIQ
jgi:hypothetical protein